MKLKKHRLKLLVQSVLNALILFFPSFVLSQTPFYQGKTITVVRGTEAGGSSDVMTRAMLPYLKKHIPGQPTKEGWANVAIWHVHAGYLCRRHRRVRDLQFSSALP